MPVPCARCSHPLPVWELGNAGGSACGYCGAQNQARVFPALLAPSHGVVQTETALEGEAACFDHPSKRAVAACQQCGRFVCQLCAVEFGTALWCPSCVAAGAGKARSARQETSRTLYDSIALILPLLSLVIYPFTILAAPASIVLTALRWGQPLSLVRRNRWRFLAAIVISVAEIALWVSVGIYLAAGRGRVR